MKRDLIEALNESLTLLEAGQVTLAECLVRYPEHAGDLRPLLKVAFELSRAPAPTSSPAAFAGGKRRMLEALAEKTRRQAPSPSPLRRYGGRIADLFSKRERPAARRRLPAFQLGLAAAMALVLLALASTLFPSWLRPTATRAATLGQVNGIVQVRPANSETWRPASAGERVDAGDKIRTGPLSAATLAFFDGSTTNLQAETEVTVIQMSSLRDDGGKIIILRQTSGQTYSRVQPLPDPASRFEIETPTAVTAVRGTEFALTVEADGTARVVVVEGVVDVTAQETTVAVQAGQETTVQPDQLPAPARPVSTVPPTLWFTPTPETTEPLKSTETPEPSEAPESLSPGKTPQPPGLTKTPQPPGLTKTRQPPGLTKTRQPPGLTKTPQPPGLTKTRQPPGLTKTPQPPGQTRAPQSPAPTKKPKPTKKP